MNQRLEQWLSVANERIHGTTKSKPNELFTEEEKTTLITLPLINFSISSWHNRKVSKDCHITLDNNYYSVPSKYVAKEVTISLDTHIVKIYIQEELIATHARSKGQGIFATNVSHYDQYKRCCPGFIEHDEKYQDQFKAMGSNCAAMLLLFQEEHKKDWHRAVKGIIKLRNFYSDEIIDKACLRALHYGISSYSKIKQILANNSYNLPLDEINSGGCHANVA